MNDQNLKSYKRGQSGNPYGRPKGARNRSTIARKWLEAGETFQNPITGKKEQLSQEDIITLAQIKEARKGNAISYKVLMDSAHGAPKQDIDVTSDGKPLQPTVIVLSDKTKKALDKI